VILVVSFDAEDGADPALAARLGDDVAEQLTLTHEVARIDAVPAFEAHGYSAATYLEACPPRRAADCTFVLGQRGGAEWALGATLRSVPDAAEPDGSIDLLEIHLVDVAAARIVAELGAPVDGEVETAHAVARLVEDALGGELALRDLRAGDLAVADVERRAQEVGRDADAATLSTLEAGTPIALRGAVVVDPERWMHGGRRGQLLVRAGGGYTVGPWHQRYAGTVVRDGETLEPVSADQALRLESAPAGVADLEAGYGITPEVEVGLAVTWRSGRTHLSIDEEVEGETDPVEPPETDVATNTWAIGARAAFVPFQFSRTRPTIGGGVSWWTGRGVDPTPPFAEMPAPHQLLAHLYPGVETDLAQSSSLFLRGSVDLPVVGDVAAPSAPGWSIGAGVLLRAGPWGRSR